MAFFKLDTSLWTFETARHLLFRAGFGGLPSEIDDFTRKGLNASIESLMQGPSRTPEVPTWLEEDKVIDPKEVRNLGVEEKKQLQRRNNQHMRELVANWIKFMMTSPGPADMLHSRMVFFWHGHFATSVQKVKATPFIYNQMKLFHEQALGNFGDFLHALIRDPAMLRYLDNEKNFKGKPNENLARELMELFSLGNGHYGENDIREGARALTGWSVEPYQFMLRTGKHDEGKKTIFGKTDNFDGDSFVKLILEQPACAEYMARKLWVYFASEEPKDTVITELASAFRNSKYDIKTLLQAIFFHPAFYTPDVMASQIKSPVQLIVGSARTLGLGSSNPEFFNRMLLMMGQVPYLPPNVKGWPGGRAWIDTSRLVTRYSFAEIVGEGKVPSAIDPRQKGDVSLAKTEAQMNSEEMAAPTEKMMALEGEMAAPAEGAMIMTEKSMEKAGKAKGGKAVVGGGGNGPMGLPRNLHVGIQVERLVAENLSATDLVDQLARILLPVPLAPDERLKLLEHASAILLKKPYAEAVQSIIGHIMLLPAFQLC